MSREVKWIIWFEILGFVVMFIWAIAMIVLTARAEAQTVDWCSRPSVVEDASMHVSQRGERVYIRAHWQRFPGVVYAHTYTPDGAHDHTGYTDLSREGRPVTVSFALDSCPGDTPCCAVVSWWEGRRLEDRL